MYFVLKYARFQAGSDMTEHTVYVKGFMNWIKTLSYYSLRDDILILYAKRIRGYYGSNK